jgi:hypothetical protein
MLVDIGAYKSSFCFLAYLLLTIDMNILDIFPVYIDKSFSYSTHLGIEFMGHGVCISSNLQDNVKLFSKDTVKNDFKNYVLDLVTLLF